MDDEETAGYLIPDRVYDVLKWVGLIALPALAVCVQTIGTAAGWTGTDLTVTILTALAPSSAHSSAPARLKPDA